MSIKNSMWGRTMFTSSPFCAEWSEAQVFYISAPGDVRVSAQKVLFSRISPFSSKSTLLGFFINIKGHKIITNILDMAPLFSPNPSKSLVREYVRVMSVLSALRHLSICKMRNL